MRAATPATCCWQPNPQGPALLSTIPTREQRETVPYVCCCHCRCLPGDGIHDSWEDVSIHLRVRFSTPGRIGEARYEKPQWYDAYRGR